MAIAADFEIQNDRDVRYIGAAHGVAGAGYYTVLAFHEWLRDLADDAQSASDDFMDITRPTPSDKSYETIVTLINNYNIDQAASEHLYQGSIIQASGDEIWDGIQIIAKEGCHIEIVQNGAIITNDFWNSTPNGETSEGLNRDVANGIASRFIVKVRAGGADIDGRRLLCQTREWFKTYSEFRINGTGRGINVVPLTYANDLNSTTAEATVSGWNDITNAEGYAELDVDNSGTPETYYSEWNRSTKTINQFYERTKWLTRRSSTCSLYGVSGEIFRGITHQVAISSGSNDWAQNETLSWGSGSLAGTGALISTCSLTSAASDSGKLFMQVLTGVAPTSGCIVSGSSVPSGSAVAGTVTERAVLQPFSGVSTGTALIGAYGLGIEVLDLGSSDKMTALDGNVYSSPNYVIFTVGGLTTSDYVLVGPRGYRFAYDNEATGPFTVGETLTFTTPAGTAVLADLFDLGTYGVMYIGPMVTGTVPQDNSTIAGTTATAAVDGAVSNDVNLRQMTLNGALIGATVTSVVVNEVIPTDTPATGTIRIKRTSGKYSRHPYSEWVGATKTFTITLHDFSGDNAPNASQVFVSYIDTTPADDDEAFTSIYSAERSLFIRIRCGGGTPPIKTFETTGVLGSAGGSSTAVRTSDA